jgi:hypothetical protein
MLSLEELACIGVVTDLAELEDSTDEHDRRSHRWVLSGEEGALARKVIENAEFHTKSRYQSLQPPHKGSLYQHPPTFRVKTGAQTTTNHDDDLDAIRDLLKQPDITNDWL